MASLVLELQQDASKSDVTLPEVLRKARMVASKLKLAEVNGWIEFELNGYPDSEDVPEYRVLYGDVRAHNPFNGYLMPVRYPDPDLQTSISTVRVRQSIGSLHEVLAAPSDYVQIPFTPHEMETLRPTFQPSMQSWIQPFRKFSKPQVSVILDSVRNRVLDWTLALEARGVLGEGLTFTSQEKERAAAMPSIRIGTVSNFQGVIGTVSGSMLDINNVAAVDGALKSSGFSKEERAEIQRLIAEHRAAKPEGKLATAKRGIQWVVDHAEKLGFLAALFRDSFGT